MITQGARAQWGRRGFRRIYALIFIDLLTGVFEFDLMDKVNSNSIKLALNSFSSDQEKVPQRVLYDPGEAICSLDRDPFHSVLHNMGITAERVGEHNHLLQFSFQTWSEINSLMMSMRKNQTKSILTQDESIEDVTRKIGLCSRIVRSTSLIIKDQDGGEKLMTKDLVLHPHISLDTLDSNAADIFAGISGCSTGIFEHITCYSGVVRNLFVHTVMTYLQDKGILYKFPRRGRRSVLGESQVLPIKGDVTAFPCTRTETRLALITEVLGNDMVELKLLFGEGNLRFREHSSQICLIFRPNNPGTFPERVDCAMKA